MGWRGGGETIEGQKGSEMGGGGEIERGEEGGMEEDTERCSGFSSPNTFLFKITFQKLWKNAQTFQVSESFQDHLWEISGDHLWEISGDHLWEISGDQYIL